MQRKVGLSLALLLCLTAVSQAAITIVAGSHNLQPNMAGQQIQILIMSNSNDPAQGMDLNVQIGGTAAGPATAGTTPVFQNVTTADILGPGNIWGSNHAGETADNSFDPTIAQYSIVTNSGTVPVPPSAVLATIMVNTTGITGGVFTLAVGPNQFAGTSDMAGGPVPAGTVDGSITVVPEPTSVVLGAFAIAGLGAVAIRKRRARKIA